MDLVFLIDGSGSIERYGRGNFKRCLRFVRRLAQSFTISKAQTRVGAIVYSSRPRLIFSLSGSWRRITSSLNRARYPRGGTRTGKALYYAYRSLLARTTRPKVLVCMTDGRSQDSVARPASYLRKRGVKIFSLGIGKRYNMRQLIQMSRTRRRVFTADFRNLGSVVRAIKQKTCKGMTNTTRHIHPFIP